jgi:hypothetical protein
MGIVVVATAGLLELKIEPIWGDYPVRSTVSGDREPTQPKPAGGSK